mgnify:CR=1 FL=1
MDVFRLLVRAQVEVDVVLLVRIHAPAADREPDTRSGKAQQALPAIGFGACPVDQAGSMEAAQDAAQVTAIEA